MFSEPLTPNVQHCLGSSDPKFSVDFAIRIDNIYTKYHKEWGWYLEGPRQEGRFPVTNTLGGPKQCRLGLNDSDTFVVQVGRDAEPSNEKMRQAFEELEKCGLQLLPPSRWSRAWARIGSLGRRPLRQEWVPLSRDTMPPEMDAGKTVRRYGKK